MNEHRNDQKWNEIYKEGLEKEKMERFDQLRLGIGLVTPEEARQWRRK